MDTVSDLAASLFCYRPEHVMNGGYLYEEWDSALVEKIGAALSTKANGLRVDLQTSEFASLCPLFKETFEVCCTACESSTCYHIIVALLFFGAS